MLSIVNTAVCLMRRSVMCVILVSASAKGYGDNRIMRWYGCYLKQWYCLFIEWKYIRKQIGMVYYFISVKQIRLLVLSAERSVIVSQHSKAWLQTMNRTFIVFNATKTVLQWYNNAFKKITQAIVEFVFLAFNHVLFHTAPLLLYVNKAHFVPWFAHAKCNVGHIYLITISVI